MIRPMEPDELEPVVRRITSMDPFLRLRVTFEDLTTGLRADTLRRVLVYEEDNEIRGAVIYRPKQGARLLFIHGFGQILAKQYNVPWPCEWQDIPDFGYIGSLAVFDGRTGQGIGLHLLRGAEARIQEAGQSIAHLTVSDFNHGARRFYLRHGYREIATLQGKLSTEHLMKKDVQPE